ncbi:alpha/beta hydrolase [Caballeronia glebae]|uniref:alpha/beta hydrolase n=1 Tax=Caballeronia glebae TaxID=1777143 RepID=UPI0038B86DF8
MIDLNFENIDVRNVQYDARGSVPNFDALMTEYHDGSERAKSRTAGIYDLHYGMGAAERLDLFPALKQPAPLFVFIHGGYWHSQTKEDACSMADNFTQHGVACATLEYTLQPEATLGEIVREVRSAIAWLYHNSAQFGVDPERIFIGGSSAGGHLSGMLIADDWQHRFQVPTNVIKGALCLSGLYDIRPLCETNINDWMRLTADQAQLLSPVFHLPKKENAPRILLDVGAKETTGFKNQTHFYYEACKQKGYDVTLLNDKDNSHFSLPNELNSASSDMFKQTMAMIQK